MRKSFKHMYSKKKKGKGIIFKNLARLVVKKVDIITFPFFFLGQQDCQVTAFNYRSVKTSVVIQFVVFKPLSYSFEETIGFYK